MAKFNEYTQKATPEDNDTLMIYDDAAKANKLSPFSGIWNWMVNKLTNAVIANLQTNNKTVLGAINELNSNSSRIVALGVKDLDNPPDAYILTTSVYPVGFPSDLEGNGCCVIQHNPAQDNFTAQLAFGFGSDKIAIRRKYNSSANWTEWKYFTAQ